MSSNIKVNRICAFCKKEFVARTTVTRCCSDHCAKRFYKLKKREEKIEESNKQTLIMGAMSVEEWKLREFFSISEFSKLVGVSRWTLWRAIKRNELTVAKIGARVIIDRKEIEKFIIKVPHHGQRDTEGEETK